MYRFIRWLVFSSVLQTVWAAPAVAHLEGSCLLALADAAESLKQCQVQAQTDTACRDHAMTLDLRQRECARQYYTPEVIAHATAHGEERVTGSIENSPLARSRATERLAHERLAPMKATFQGRFGIEWQHYAGMLDDHFNSPSCPGQIEGVAGRYRLVGSYKLKRWLLEEWRESEVPFTWYFVEPMTPGRCYPSPLAGEVSEWHEAVLLNIPREFLLDLAALRDANRVFICRVASDCDAQRDLVMASYAAYLDAVANYFGPRTCRPQGSSAFVSPACRGDIDDGSSYFEAYLAQGRTLFGSSDWSSGGP